MRIGSLERAWCGLATCLRNRSCANGKLVSGRHLCRPLIITKAFICTTFIRTTSWLAGPEIWLAWRQAWLAGPQACLDWPQAWLDGLEKGGGWTNERTKRKSLQSTGLSYLRIVFRYRSCDVFLENTRMRWKIERSKELRTPKLRHLLKHNWMRLLWKGVHNSKPKNVSGRPWRPYRIPCQ